MCSYSHPLRHTWSSPQFRTSMSICVSLCTHTRTHARTRVFFFLDQIHRNKVAEPQHRVLLKFYMNGKDFPEVHVLDTWSPANGVTLGGTGDLGRLSLAGGGGVLGQVFGVLFLPPISCLPVCFLTCCASPCKMQIVQPHILSQQHRSKW